MSHPADASTQTLFTVSRGTQTPKYPTASKFTQATQVPWKVNKKPMCPQKCLFIGPNCSRPLTHTHTLHKQFTLFFLTSSYFQMSGDGIIKRIETSSYIISINN
ncbi:hypothetical protein AMELA_G00254550 [Ameiurus melas]|uniref:Uncharacterized protein n=1 Tax=Ameiurus melas TaxID=219545 RepID=A0A7J5ZTS4_AMEME|nr:hypothetical protein AMELA_G00254550 [Ameiurus melas]